MAEWFEQKRFGIGAGMPISWQGWAVTAAYMVIILASLILFADRPAMLLGILIPTTAALLVIAAGTTRGGWRWRWGAKD